MVFFLSTGNISSVVSISVTETRISQFEKATRERWMRLTNLSVIFSSVPSEAPVFGFKVSNGSGPYPEVSIWWEEYHCDEHPAFYIISICRNGAVCTDARTGSTNYTLKTSDRFPIVRWKDYRVNITGLCGGVSVELREFHVDTGAGGGYSNPLILFVSRLQRRRRIFSPSESFPMR